MAVKPCVECGRDVSTSARTCPHCGRNNPTGALLGTWSTGAKVGLGCLAIVIVLVLVGQQAAEHIATSPRAQSSLATRRAPQYTITASRLFADYHANEVAADNEYKGRYFTITGTVTSIDKNFLDQIIIRIGTPNMFEDVMASLESSEANLAAQLHKGQSVGLLCKVDGMIIGSPSLSDCTFTR